VAGKSEASRVRAKAEEKAAEEKAAEDKAVPVVSQKDIAAAPPEHLSLFRSASFPSCTLSAFFAESSAGLFG
ncbi:MAG: hypothetical protein DMF38_06630, partial [Verrucomicrobia bacterium]